MAYFGRTIDTSRRYVAPTRVRRPFVHLGALAPASIEMSLMVEQQFNATFAGLQLFYMNMNSAIAPFESVDIQGRGFYEWHKFYDRVMVTDYEVTFKAVSIANPTGTHFEPDAMVFVPTAGSGPLDDTWDRLTELPLAVSRVIAPGDDAVIMKSRGSIANLYGVPFLDEMDFSTNTTTAGARPKRAVFGTLGVERFGRDYPNASNVYVDVTIVQRVIFFSPKAMSAS